MVEFVNPIQPGLSQRDFMTTLEARIEGASNTLMAEAGFTALPSESQGTAAE